MFQRCTTNSSNRLRHLAVKTKSLHCKPNNLCWTMNRQRTTMCQEDMEYNCLKTPGQVDQTMFQPSTLSRPRSRLTPKYPHYTASKYRWSSIHARMKSYQQHTSDTAQRTRHQETEAMYQQDSWCMYQMKPLRLSLTMSQLDKARNQRQG